MRPVDRERGSGTVLVVAVVGLVLVLSAAIGLLARAQTARQRAQGAADLAALAAASSISAPFGVVIAAPGEAGGTGRTGGGAACHLALDVAVRNEAQVTSCSVLPGGVVQVAVARGTVVGPARATARAGPVSARDP